MSLRQPFPPVSAPMVDSNGIPTPSWVQFFLTLFNRTNGAQGPAATLDGSSSASIASLTSQVATLQASTVATDAEWLAVLGDIVEPQQAVAIDQAVFMAQLVADAGVS